MSTSCAGVDQRAPYHHLRSSGAAETSLAGHGPSVGSLDHSTVALAFSAVLALQNRGPVAPHAPPRPEPDWHNQPARQHRGSWPGCLFAHPALPAVRLSVSFPQPSSCLKTLRFRSGSPEFHTQQTHSASFGPGQALAFLPLLLCGDTKSPTAASWPSSNTCYRAPVSAHADRKLGRQLATPRPSRA